MNPTTPTMASLSSAVAALLRGLEYFFLVWENEILPAAGIAAVERRVARAFAGRGVVISPWHGRMPEARAALAAGRVTPLEGTLEVELGPGVTKTLRVLVAEPAGRQRVLFLALDGFFEGQRSPYDTPQLGADALAFAMAADALLAAALPAGGPFAWAADWETAPALLLLRARHATALHLHNAYDAWLGRELAHLRFPRAEALAHATALRAGATAADVLAAVNAGFAQALHDAAWPVYTRVLAPHLQDVAGRIEAVTNGPFVEMRPEWRELLEALRTDAHRAGQAFAASVLPRRRAHLGAAWRQTISSRAIVLVSGRSVTQKLPEVAIAAARRVLAEGNFRGFFVFALLPGDAFTEQRAAQLRALREEFPREVLVIENDPGLFAQVLAVADVQVFSSAWEPHGSVFHGPAVPVAFGEGPGAQIASWRTGGPAAAAWQARFHDRAAPANGLWLYADAAGPVEAVAEDWRALVAAPPAAGNRVFAAMVDELAAGLRLMAGCWSREPAAFAALVRGALERQADRGWGGADSYGRMFDLIARGRDRPRCAA